jgi:hypothetical protein
VPRVAFAASGRLFVVVGGGATTNARPSEHVTLDAGALTLSLSDVTPLPPTTVTVLANSRGSRERKCTATEVSRATAVVEDATGRPNQALGEIVELRGCAESFDFHDLPIAMASGPSDVSWRDVALHACEENAERDAETACGTITASVDVVVETATGAPLCRPELDQVRLRTSGRPSGTYPQSLLGGVVHAGQKSWLVLTNASNTSDVSFVDVDAHEGGSIVAHGSIPYLFDVMCSSEPAPAATLASCPVSVPARWRGLPLPYEPDPPSSCQFLDDRVAWIGTFEEDAGAIRAVIWRTADGGVTWLRSRLGKGEPNYTPWAVSPEMELEFKGPSRGTVHVIDMPQHHNGHRQSEAWFGTADGGATWGFLRSKTKCLDVANQCRGG